MAGTVAKIFVAPNDLGPAELLSCAYSMLAARKALHGPLPSAILADPALDILLKLVVGRGERRDVTIDELAQGSTVPQSVILRWLKVLECAGTVDVTETEDQRRVYALSDRGVGEMDAALTAVIRSQIALHGN